VSLSHYTLADNRGVMPPYPPPADGDAWACWWHTWAAIGRAAAALDPLGPIYTPEYLGDDNLPGAPSDMEEVA
jgi:hypothetical protein